LQWIHQRAAAKRPDDLNRNCPTVWRTYLAGHTKKLFTWMRKVRPPSEQLPLKNSDAAQILGQICALSARQFELFCTKLFEEIANYTGVQHQITETRLVKDSGFDFFGRFILPQPLKYEIPFKGEAKKYHRANGVGPKFVSRLVARLRRGEY